jgi:SAM-dependent methyltransferase
MKRIIEPQLMETREQARAYAAADFDAAHRMYPALFAEKFPHRPARALVLDLGCGPCDVVLRFARANPGYSFHAVDGSSAMLREARRMIARGAKSEEPVAASRIRLIHGFIPGAAIPRRRYDVILSSSVLHHLHDPGVLWQTIRERSAAGTLVFVADLRRPQSRVAARRLVNRHAGDDPAVLKSDFYNSLLAAFTPAEVRLQLKRAELGGLHVESIGNRHLIVFGRI